ncbi:MAG: hypothetical protein ABJ143_00825, partial [Parasphingorhabdus sp.]
MRYFASLIICILMTGCADADADKACSPPRASWESDHSGPWAHELILVNQIALDSSGQTYWNQEVRELQEITMFLKKSRTFLPQPMVRFVTEMGVPCDKLETVRDTIEENFDCDRTGHCDEGIPGTEDIPL